MKGIEMEKISFDMNGISPYVNPFFNKMGLQPFLCKSQSNISTLGFIDLYVSTQLLRLGT